MAGRPAPVVRPRSAPDRPDRFETGPYKDSDQGRIVVVAAGLALLLILWTLVGIGALRGLDGPVHAWTLRHRPPGSGTVIKWLLAGEMGLLAAVLAWLLRGHVGLLVRLGALVIGAEGVVWVLKHAGRGWDVPWYANNFPSGHTTVGALLCLVLARALARLPVSGPVGRLRGLCFALAGQFGLLAVFPMGHVPSEMVGGFVLAITAAQIGGGWIAVALPPLQPVAVDGTERLLHTGEGRPPY